MTTLSQFLIPSLQLRNTWYKYSSELFLTVVVNIFENSGTGTPSGTEIKQLKDRRLLTSKASPSIHISKEVSYFKGSFVSCTISTVQTFMVS